MNDSDPDSTRRLTDIVAPEPATPAPAELADGPDLTTGSLLRNIWILAVPMILEQLTISVFRPLDAFWVGKLGAAALAAVSMGGTVVWTVNQIGLGLGVGAAAIVSRRIGERNRAGANNAVVQAILVGMVVALVGGLAGFLLAERIMTWLGPNPRSFRWEPVTCVFLSPASSALPWSI